MAFAVDDYRALVQLLLEHPEWRAELRPLILGEEIESLPGRMDRVEAALERLGERLDQLGERLDRLTAQVEKLAESHDALNTKVSRIDGYVLESRYYDHVGAWFGQWLRKPKAVSPDDLDLVEAALAEGRMTGAEITQLRSADMIVSGVGRGPELSGPVVLTAEISVTIDAHDVERADDRAGILRRVGYESRGLVGGTAVTAAAVERASELRVFIDLRSG